MPSCDGDEDEDVGEDDVCCCCCCSAEVASLASNRESKKVDENGWVNWYKVPQKSSQNCDDESWDACDWVDAMCFFSRVCLCLLACLLISGGSVVGLRCFVLSFKGVVSWVRWFEAMVDECGNKRRNKQ